MSICDPCVSISTGTLSPDRRVNYAYGMVLGLDEFLQEQQYFLNKDHLHERALHGYGTVYGLQVTVAEVAGAQDYTVSVAPGMAIDQWGREIVIRSAQCARLGAWLSENEQSDPSGMSANLGPSGDLTVYVVAKYDECLDDLVPLPGQPCSSSEQSMVPSRIRDSWDIDLTWTRPAMPSWDTDRRLARLLNSVQIVADLDPSLSSEDEIIAAILALPSDVDAGPDDLWPLVDWPSTPSDAPSGPVVYRLPADEAADAIDRIFTVWVTQVRPLLAPDLTTPLDSVDPSILLASITFTVATVASPSSTTTSIGSCEPPDDAGRPYVLHTRLIQELRILDEARAGTTTTAQELATLTSDVDDQGRVILTAWFHLDQPVALTEPIQVRSRSGASGSFDPSAPADPSGAVPEFSDVWILTPKSEFPVIDRDQVAVTVVPGAVLVGDENTTLADDMNRGLDLLDTTPSHDVLVYGTVVTAAVVPPPPPPALALPPLDFVTITSASAVDVSDDFFMQFWFHPRPHSEAGPWVRMRAIEPETVTYIEESDQTTRGRADRMDQISANVWAGNFHSTFGQRAGYVRFLFLASKILVTVADTPDPQDPGEEMTLLEWMEKAQITFVDWDPAEKTISAYAHLDGKE